MNQEQKHDSENKECRLDDIFILIRKDPLTDAKKYFNRAIETTRQAMALKTTSFENYVLCLQIQIMSQLYVENFDGTIAIIRHKLEIFSKMNEVKKLYYYMFFNCADLDSKEIKTAYSIYQFMNKLKMICVINDEFIKNKLTISVDRPWYYLSSSIIRGMDIDITDPMIKFKADGKAIIIFRTGCTGWALISWNINLFKKKFSQNII